MPKEAVYVDHFEVGKKRAECLLNKGHRKIARLNTQAYAQRGDEGEEFCGFCSALASAGVVFDPAWSIPPEQISERLPALLLRDEITAAVVNGGDLQMLNVFKTLAESRNGERLALLVDDIGPSLADMVGRYPGVKVEAVNFAPDYELGVTAGELMLRHLLDGQPLAAVAVPPSLPQQWRPGLYQEFA